MAGIGFELRKLLKKDSMTGLLQAYAYAGIISSGPWVLSILGVMLVGILSIGLVVPQTLIIQYLVSITYLMAFSLILTGPLQLLFTRFISDRLFEKKDEQVLPNLFGAMLLVTLTSGTVGAILLPLVFSQMGLYQLLMLMGFVLLSNVWIVTIFLSGMKAYHEILAVFFTGYAVSVLASMSLVDFGANGLLGGFVLGQAVLFFLMLFLTVRDYPGMSLLSFSFLNPRKVFYSLAIVGLLFNLGVWKDKFLFWFSEETSIQIIGELRASLIYDLPIFLAYLSIIPGMAVFLVRMETDFAEAYERFYDAVRNGDTLEHIEAYKDHMILTIQQGFYEIFKIQGLTIVTLFVIANQLLNFIGLSPLYIYLFQIDLVGVGMQVLFLAILNVMFYLDLRRSAVLVSLLFLILNAGLSALSIHLGPQYYGYGFALAMTFSSIVGIFLLQTRLARLEYETFMLQ